MKAIPKLNSVNRLRVEPNLLSSSRSGVFVLSATGKPTSSRGSATSSLRTASRCGRPSSSTEHCSKTGSFESTSPKARKTKTAAAEVAEEVPAEWAVAAEGADAAASTTEDTRMAGIRVRSSVQSLKGLN